MVQTIRPIFSEELPFFRDKIWEMIQRGLKRGSIGYKTAEDYMEEVDEELAIPWVNLKGGEVTDMILVEIRTKDGEQFGRVILIAGQNKYTIADVIDKAEEVYSKANVVKKFEFLARPGAAELLMKERGYKEIGRFVSKRLN